MPIVLKTKDGTKEEVQVHEEGSSGAKKMAKQTVKIKVNRRTDET